MEFCPNRRGSYLICCTQLYILRRERHRDRERGKKKNKGPQKVNGQEGHRFGSKARNLGERAYWERLLPRRSHDGGPYDGNVHVPTLLVHHHLSQGLGVRVSIGPIPDQLGCDLINNSIV